MAVKRLTLPQDPPLVEWFVESLIPSGYVSVLFAKQGEGKTQLAAYLAVQAARPQGVLGRRAVRHGRVVILDADDPGGLGYSLWLNRFLRAYGDADRGLLDLRAVEGGLTPEDVLALEEELKADPPALIILDAFASAFLGVDVLKPNQVHAPIRALTSLAQATGSALLLLDHVGKLAPGQTVAEKGPLGSTAKLFSPRAAFALDRMPPREVEGRDVLKLTCIKQSYAPLPPPLGLELLWLEDGEGAYFRPYLLPESTTLEEQAEKAILALLGEAGEEGLPRKVLLAEVVARANVSERTATRALGGLRAKGVVAEEELPRPGRPKVLKLSIPLAQNRGNALQDEKIFCANPLAQNPPFGTKTPEGGSGDGTPFREGPRLSTPHLAGNPSPQEEPEVEL
ncbi:AAA family ATPase [Thermus sp.]|uniref:AAA family ATPase n=1 Tax=Thermus sp. TaxID=275 RepID=UPI0025D966A5|nr:AAA family ATPase [Thermus sp.]MCS6869278.1 AAA family ATPase [Thermus sp.]